ncbi:MAG: pilus assembly protein, partial [Pseudobdellovibrionaceae bacterium]
WIHVLLPEQKYFYLELKKQLSKKIGLKVHLRKGKIYIQGILARDQDFDDLSRLAKSMNSGFILQTQMSQKLKINIQNKVNKQLKNQGLPLQNISFAESLETQIFNKNENIDSYEKILGFNGVEVVRTTSSLDLAPTVKVQITVAEIKKNAALNYGIKWPETYAATVLPNGEKQFSNLDWTASAIERNGWGRVLASPNILCRSGKTAEFMAGGEIPIKILNFKMQSITWKPYGILLKVSPLADASGRISLSLQTEISTLDKSSMVDGVPGILKNSVSSHFDLLESQTIALSGLIKNENGQSSQGLPGLSSLPILGGLFGSQDYLANRSELVIFVRPEVLSNNPEPIEKNNLSHLGGGIDESRK